MKSPKHIKLLDDQPTPLISLLSFVLSYYQPALIPISFILFTCIRSFLKQLFGKEPRVFLLVLTVKIQDHMAPISHVLQQWFPMRGKFIPQGTFVSVWGHFWLSQQGAGHNYLYSVEARGTSQYPIIPQNRITEPQITIVPEAENLDFKASYCILKAQTSKHSGRLRQEVCKFEPHLGNIPRLCLKIKNFKRSGDVVQ